MSRRRTASLIPAAVAATALTLAIPGTAAAAIPMCPLNNMCHYEYFETSEHETVIGHTFVDCDGASDHHGSFSPHVSMSSHPCP
ncbi:hypothetical protein [Stackebrandtia soli]|uniref:hypothetical protein n=1 Tax=Stackebrandtia soli TaxID=1892856 RepID=UPI0039EC8521